jgi:hypothetical protein
LLKNQHLKRVPDDLSLNGVHPSLYERNLKHLTTELELLRARPLLTLSTALRLLPSLAWNAAGRRMKRYGHPFRAESR